MVKVLIGVSGSGKTYKIKNEIFHKYHGTCMNSRKIYVIEREKYKEYSGLFNNEYVTALTSEDDLSFLMNKKNADIYIDSEIRSKEFLEFVSALVKRARTHKNQITITFQEILSTNQEVSSWQHSILSNADKILVGLCYKYGELYLNDLFDTFLSQQKDKYDFREIICHR